MYKNMLERATEQATQNLQTSFNFWGEFHRMRVKDVPGEKISRKLKKLSREFCSCPLWNDGG
jgi:hypothetical protein